MTQYDRTLDLLAVFHYVVGGMMILFSSLLLIHLAMGVAILTGGFEGADAPPEFMGWIFVVLPGLAILFAWTLAGFVITSGRRLKRRTNLEFCMIVAGIECVFMPLGTALGIFTLLILSKQQVKELFEAGTNPCHANMKKYGGHHT